MSVSEIGLIGLGTMGSALALNIAEKGFAISVWNRKADKTNAFVKNAGDLASKITPTTTLEELVQSIKTPRTIILMVPAGAPVDEQVKALTPLLDKDDLIIDAGNENFHETRRRTEEAEVGFMGIGVSGGEEGARHGPAIMAGGTAEQWSRVEPVLTAIAAKYKGEPCAAHMGTDGAGHFVKAVHNGIEYADMQLISEVYGIMRDGLGMKAAEIGDVFDRWNEGALKSYLIEISGKVAGVTDEASGKPLLDIIVDAAGQKGTGRWTAVEAQHLGAPIPIIEAAIAARNMSARRELRSDLEGLFGDLDVAGGAKPSLEQLEQALICGKVLCYAQGFDMIRLAGQKFGWELDLPQIARTWREGCIIRSAMLDDMASALSDMESELLITAPYFADIIKNTQRDMRRVLSDAIALGLPAPAMSAAVPYLDTMRQARGTANMVQGQRDFFGLHGFKRLDQDGDGHHGPWAKG